MAESYNFSIINHEITQKLNDIKFLEIPTIEQVSSKGRFDEDKVNALIKMYQDTDAINKTILNQVILDLNDLIIKVHEYRLALQTRDKIVKGALSEDKRKLNSNGKIYRSGYEPINVTGAQNFPIPVSLKRQKYGRFYAVALDMQYSQADQKIEMTIAEQEKLNETLRAKRRRLADSYAISDEKGKYIYRKFAQVAYLGGNIKSVEWMYDEKLMEFPEEREALILHFIEEKKLRKYPCLARCFNDEMSIYSFNGQGHSYIEGNSRSKMLTDGWRSKAKDGKRYYTRQYLIQDDEKYKFIKIEPGKPMANGKIARRVESRELPYLIRKFRLEDVFAMTKKEIYPIIYPYQRDWNHKGKWIIVNRNYIDDPSCREQVNKFSAKLHQEYSKDPIRCKRIVQLRLVVPKPGTFEDMGTLEYIPSEGFRGWGDYDESLVAPRVV